ncbi:MAG: hypothetical protein ACK4K0_10190 [Flavobacteriales bacterium]
MKLFTKILISGIFIAMMLNSCLKKEEFPPEPELTFISFTKMSADSAVFTFSFVDGDGDIGLEIGDTLPPYNASGDYHYNLVLQYYERKNGEWVKGTEDPSGDNSPNFKSIISGYRIKNITPTGQNKLLKGQIDVFIEPFYFNPFSNWNDTIQWRAFMYDRALNKSNIIESNPIPIL